MRDRAAHESPEAIVEFALVDLTVWIWSMDARTRFVLSPPIPVGSRRPVNRFGALALVVAALLSSSSASLFAAEGVRADAGDLPDRARGTRVGDSIRVTDLVLDNNGERVELQLERFDVFAADAAVVVHDA